MFWNIEEVEKLTSLLEKTDVRGRSFYSLAKEFKQHFPKRGISSLKSKIQTLLGENPKVPILKRDLIKKIWANYTLPLKQAKERFNRIRNSIPANSKMLVIGDIHLPGIAFDVFEKALTEDVDIIVLNGDIVDFKRLGRFSLYPPYLEGKKPTLGDELGQLDEILHRCTKKATTYYICGNHDARFLKSLQGISREFLESFAERVDLFQFLTGGSEVIACPFWFQSFHNVTVGHPEQSSSVLVRTPEWAKSFIKNRGLQGSNVWVMGHTHNFGKAIWNNHILIEGGSASQSLDWQFTGRLHITQRKRSWAKGYVVIEFKNKKATWDTIRLEYMGGEEW